MLEKWRSKQSDQEQLCQSFIAVLKNNQRHGDCNRLISSIENTVKTKSLVENTPETKRGNKNESMIKINVRLKIFIIQGFSCLV